MQVLLFLIQQAGKKVTKEQIIEHVWKGRFVTEDILSVTVSKIRKALGDNARSPTFIKTLPSEGYILIAEVKKIESTEQISSKKVKLLNAYVAALVLLLMACLAIYFLLSDEDSTANQINRPCNKICVTAYH
jgi:DNA-binding winged helix-turn-helix (wHTH) protein